jgi:hypothetical protein
MTFTLSVSRKPYTNTAKNQQDWLDPEAIPTSYE